ncbi:MAG: hypothetical protein JWN94_1648 [Betaproteobacteria bacterium]|nr:hypothetical protein [Betaproteobacteria bacterium]
MSFYTRGVDWLSRLVRAQQRPLSVDSDAAGDDPAFYQRVEAALGGGHAAEAERLCKAHIARGGDNRFAHERLAHLLLEQGRINDALTHFRAVDVMEGRRDWTTEAFANERLDIERARRGEPHFRWLDDVRVETAYWTIMQGDRIYNDDVHAKNLATSPFVQRRVSADGHRIVASLPPVARAIDEPCVLVGGDENFSHWLFRNVLKLSSLDRAGMLYEYPWLINADLKKYQSEYLALLGQRPERLIKVERNSVLACRRLLVPALHVSTRAVTEGIGWIRGRFAHLLAGPATRRIFISRRDGQRRSLLNEDDVFEALREWDFERVVPGEMSVVEQIETFASARCIVAAHGAALTNMIFSPPATAIVEITSTAIEHMNLFRKLARSTHHEIESIVSADYPEGAAAAGVNADYRVDVKAVRAAVARRL